MSRPMCPGSAEDTTVRLPGRDFALAWLNVSLASSNDDSLAALALLPAPVVVMSTDDMTVRLGVVEMPFSSWRQMWPQPARRASVKHLVFDVELLALLDKVKGSLGLVDMTFHSEAGVAVIAM